VSSNGSYAVEASTNLLVGNDWTRLSTNFSSTSTLVFADSSASNFLQRFYRLVTDP
jgi:hypothetical protein